VVASEAGEFDGEPLVLEQPPREGGVELALHQVLALRLRAHQGLTPGGDEVDATARSRGEAAQQVVHGGEVELGGERADEAPPRLVDGDGEDDDVLPERVVAVRVTQRRVIRPDGGGPVRRQMGGRRLPRRGRHRFTPRVHDQQLRVVREALAHGAQVVGETRQCGGAAAARDQVEVLRHLVRAREHAQLVQPLLDPQIHFARGLRAHALQLARDLLRERALVLQVGDPRGGERRDQRGEDAEHQHFAADAVQPQQAQSSRDDPLPGRH